VKFKTAKITAMGQITVPNKVRRALGVSAGDRLGFEERDGEMRMVPIRAESRLLAIVASAIRRLAPARRPSCSGCVCNVAMTIIVDTNVATF
jgi:AbrB family looped-hinge helix DNA binding protein